MNVKITKDSRLLILNQWENEWRDVTDHAIQYLYYVCELEDGVTLQNIFDIIEQNIDTFTLIHGSWLGELIDESKREVTKVQKDEFDLGDLEYLELKLVVDKHTSTYKDGSVDSNWNVGPLSLYDISGVSKILNEDNEEFTVKKGERINYGISFTPVNKLIDLPIKVNDDFEINELIVDFNGEVPFEKKNIVTITDLGITFGDLIHSLFYEFTFYGPPNKRDEQLNELKESVKKIEDGTAELVELDTEELLKGKI